MEQQKLNQKLHSILSSLIDIESFLRMLDLLEFDTDDFPDINKDNIVAIFENGLSLREWEFYAQNNKQKSSGEPWYLSLIYQNPETNLFESLFLNAKMKNHKLVIKNYYNNTQDPFYHTPVLLRNIDCLSSPIMQDKYTLENFIQDMEGKK